MKTAIIIASGALLLCLSLLGANAAGKPSCQQHCNGRFGYCLSYPASLFPNTFISTDEDSLVFKTADMLGELTVIGTETDAKLDSHQAFDQRLRALTSSGGQANILSIINGDDYYEVSFLYDGHWYHQKAGFFQKYDVLYTLRVPVNRTELMVRLKEDVVIEF